MIKITKATNNQAGITLLSLIITIIILLILATVAMSTFKGDGIIKNSQKAVDMAKVESMREEIKMAIINKIVKNDREITIEQIIEQLEKQDIIKAGDCNIETGQVKTQPDGYVYEIKEKANGDWEVTYIGNGELTLPELLIALSPNTTGITNSVTITMTAKAESGISSYTLPKGTEQTVTSGTKEITTTYTATENGTYTFTVTNGNGKTESKSITIDNILEGIIVISASPTTPTKENVTVKVTWPSGASGAIKEVQVGEENWKVYTGEESSVEVTSNCTVKVRVRNSIEEIKTATCTINNIDKTNPTVTAKEDTVTITEGDSYSLGEYFTITANGTYGIASMKYTDTSNGNAVVTNTNTLAVGTHVIKCTATKETGATGSASVRLVVEGVVIATVEEPVLMEGMTAVYWSTDGGVTASTTEEGASPIYSKVGGKSNGTDNSAFKWENWYAYVEGNNIKDTKKSRWANAVTDDGSYWVWIPRFKYKISEEPTEAGTTNAGKIEVQFISTEEKSGATANGSTYTTAANSEGEMLTTDGNGYIIHPAFENGSSSGKNNGYANGEWDSELPGFWVAKYEMSREDSSDGGVTWSQTTTTGNEATSSTIRMVSKAGVRSWGIIQIGQVYQNCINYDTSKNSHMIKNSEWGAVAYLTHSQYGRNRNEVTINDSKGYYTGNAGDSPTDSSTQSGIGHAYNTTAGMKASTTGNIYGVYDMNGGGSEYTACWDTVSSSSYITKYGKAVDGTVYFSTGGTSDRTKTAYSNGTSEAKGSAVKTVCRSGDGVKETWVSGERAWYYDGSRFVFSNTPFMNRGGSSLSGEGSGMFSSYYHEGSAVYSNQTFRVVLADGRVKNREKVSKGTYYFDNLMKC